jgi:hypothetical protein
LRSRIAEALRMLTTLRGPSAVSEVSARSAVRWTRQRIGADKVAAIRLSVFDLLGGLMHSVERRH